MRETNKRIEIYQNQLKLSAYKVFQASLNPESCLFENALQSFKLLIETQMNINDKNFDRKSYLDYLFRTGSFSSLKHMDKSVIFQYTLMLAKVGEKHDKANRFCHEILAFSPDSIITNQSNHEQNQTNSKSANISSNSSSGVIQVSSSDKISQIIDDNSLDVLLYSQTSSYRMIHRLKHIFKMLELLMEFTRKNSIFDFKDVLTKFPNNFIKWKDQNIIYSLYSLGIFVRHFPSSLEQFNDEWHSVLSDALKSQDIHIRNLAISIVIDVCELLRSPYDELAQSFLIILSQNLYNPGSPIIEGCLDAVSSVIRTQESMATLFTFGDSPIPLIIPTITEPVYLSFKCITLAFATTPFLFSTSKQEINLVYSSFGNAIRNAKKKDQHYEILKVFGNFIDYTYDKIDKNIYSQAISELEKNLDCPEAFYAYFNLYKSDYSISDCKTINGSTDTSSTENDQNNDLEIAHNSSENNQLSSKDQVFLSNIEKAFLYPMNQCLFEGFQNFMKHNPTSPFNSKIRSQLINKLISDYFLQRKNQQSSDDSQESDPVFLFNYEFNELICYMLNALSDMNLTQEEVTGSLITSVCDLLYIDDIEVKTSVVNFLLSIQDFNDNIPLRLLSLCVSEVSVEFRIYFLSRMHFKQSFLLYLLPLINDQSLPIRLKAIEILSNISKQGKQAQIFLKNIFFEILEKIQKPEYHMTKFDYQSLLIFIPSLPLSSPLPNYLSRNLSLLIKIVFYQFNYTHEILTSSIILLKRLLQLQETLTPNEEKDLFLILNQIIRFQSSYNRTIASLDLLLISLNCTHISNLLLGPPYQIINSLTQMAKCTNNELIKIKLVEIISKIGILPSFLKYIDNSISINEQQFNNEKDQNHSKTYDNEHLNANSLLSLTNSNSPHMILDYISLAIISSILLSIMTDNSLSSLQEIALNDINIICKHYKDINGTIGDILISKIQKILTNKEGQISDVLLMKISSIISAFGKRTGILMPYIVDFICTEWNNNRIAHSDLLHIIDWLSTSLMEDFLPYLHKVSTTLLTSFSSMPEDILNTFVSFGNYLSVYPTDKVTFSFSFNQHLMNSKPTGIDDILIPTVLQWILSHVLETSLVNSILEKLRFVLLFCKNDKFGAAVIQTLILSLNQNIAILPKCQVLFCVLAYQMREKFLVFLPSIFNFIMGTDVEIIIQCNLKHNDIPSEIISKYISIPRSSNYSGHCSVVEQNVKKPQIVFPSQEFTPSQWFEWYNKIGDEFISNSSIKAISACKNLIPYYLPLKNELFPLALASEIVSLDDSAKLFFQTVLQTPKVPADISRAFLRASELLELLSYSKRNSESNVKYFDSQIIARRASETRQYALAIRQYESVFEIDQSSTAEILIRLNQKLGYQMEANGILRKVLRSQVTETSELVQLVGLWEDALFSYEQELESYPNDEKLLKGKMRCLQELGRYQELDSMDNKPEIYVAASSFRLQKWPEFSASVSNLKSFVFSHNPSLNNDSQQLLTQWRTIKGVDIDIALYFAIDAVRKCLENGNEDDNTKNGNIEINLVRKLCTEKLLPDLCDQAVPEFGKLILLTEMEEGLRLHKINRHMNEFFNSNLLHEKQMIEDSWKRRFDIIIKQLHRSPSLVQQSLYDILIVRSFFVEPNELNEYWKIFVDKTTILGSTDLGLLALSQLDCSAPETFLYSSKLSRADKNYEEADRRLDLLIKQHPDFIPAIKTKKEWCIEEHKYMEALNLFKKDPPTHASDYLAMSICEKALFESTKRIKHGKLAIKALFSGLKSIERSIGNKSIHKKLMKFTLPLILLLLKGGLESEFQQGALEIEPLIWLPHLPQIMSNRKNCSQLIMRLCEAAPERMLYSLFLENGNDEISFVRSKYPNLTSSLEQFRKEIIRCSSSMDEIWQFALKDASEFFLTLGNDEKEIISKESDENSNQQHPLIETFSENSDTFMESELNKKVDKNNKVNVNLHQISSISRTKSDQTIEAGLKKLSDLSIPFELSGDTISNKASSAMSCGSFRSADHRLSALITKIKSKDKSVTIGEVISNVMKPVHELSFKTPETASEALFWERTGIYIKKADSLLNLYLETNNKQYLHELWNVYFIIFDIIKKSIYRMNKVALADFSPALVKNFQEPNPSFSILHIPSNFINSVFIQSVSPSLTIIQSNNRPRKISFTGNDGRIYQFLLKSHEDIRVDARVMQVFNLFNSLISNDQFSIETYGVLPLTHNAGLLEWVESCKTLLEISGRHGSIDDEYNLILHHCHQIGEDYEKMNLDIRVEIFLEAMKLNKGDELKRELLEDAQSAPEWISMRSDYAASLASSSIVGYILGIGDRHISNLMIKNITSKPTKSFDLEKRCSWKVVHIDFGECFEGTRIRKKYPEFVPIRLTRLLIKALDAGGTEGAVRAHMIAVMKTLRGNADVIRTMIETIVRGTPAVITEGQTPQRVLDRVQQKLSGTDYSGKMDEEAQIEAIISEATDPRNLCRMFRGWTPWI